MFIEEPCQAQNHDIMAEIARGTHLPIATGERVFTKWGFREVLEKRAATILQPDLCHAGGITEVRLIAGMAEAYYAAIAPHNPLGPISLAAGVQIAASIPNFLCQEQVSLGEGYLKQPFVVREGYLDLPTGPGLGIELDENALADKIGHDWKNPGSLRRRRRLGHGLVSTSQFAGDGTGTRFGRGHSVAARILGREEGVIGCFEEGVDRLGGGREFRDADRDGERRESGRRAQSGSRLAGRFSPQRRGLRPVQPGEEGDDPVVVDPCHDVARADHQGDVLSDGLHGPIGTRLTHELSNPSQAVDRQAKQRDRLPVPLCLSHGKRQHGVQERRVLKTRNEPSSSESGHQQGSQAFARDAAIPVASTPRPGHPVVLALAVEPLQGGSRQAAQGPQPSPVHGEVAHWFRVARR